MVDANDYKSIIEHIDERTVREAFVGIWRSRDDFGGHMLRDMGAELRLQPIADWLRPYVRLDGARYAAELEADGHFVIADVAQGVCVFDGPIIRAHQQ
jgi:hypothetical protein